jgi:hypothetical protein
MKKFLIFVFVFVLFLPLLSETKKYVRVAVETARVREIPSLEGKVIARLKKGTELEVIEKVGEWFRVYLPDGKTTGYISSRVVVVSKEVEEKEVKEEKKMEEKKIKEEKKPVEKRREVVRRGEIEKPLSLFVAFSFDAPFADFKDEYLIRAYNEDGPYSGRYNASASFCPEIGLIYRIKEKIGILFSVEPFISKTKGDILAQIPHPFYFAKFRDLVIKDNFSYSEIPFNLNVTYDTGKFKGVSILLTGGLTLFYSSAEILESFTYADIYPYDNVTLTSTKYKAYSSFSPGLNVGIASFYPFKESINAGVQVKASFGKASFKPEGRDKVSYTLGGLKAGVYFRFSF